MFKVGEKIIINNVGVCTVKDIIVNNFGNSTKEYYVFIPCFKDTNDKVMLPIDTIKKMRYLSSIEEINNIINGNDYVCYWEKDPRQRKEVFLNLLENGSLKEYYDLYLTIENKKIELLANKKMINSTDKYVLDTVIKIISEEISASSGKDYYVVFNEFNNRFKAKLVNN